MMRAAKPVDLHPRDSQIVRAVRARAFEKRPEAVVGCDRIEIPEGPGSMRARQRGPPAVSVSHERRSVEIARPVFSS